MLFPEIVYGPIHSRRLGLSLGINLMPVDAKLCTYDCIYCECGFNQPVSHPILPTRAQVYEALQAKLQEMAQAQVVPDVFTFSGNGEPTLHPDFEGIITDTCLLRDRFCPKAQVSVLSNATQLHREDVVRALRMCDNRILKLDSAITATMRRIDAPSNPSLTAEQIIERLSRWHGDFTLQTCFLQGTLLDGSAIDNTTLTELQSWYAAVRLLHPKMIMIYVIDRATPVQTLQKISRQRMEEIAAPLVAEGFNVQISA